MKIRSLNYPQKFKYDNVNLIISANFLSATVGSGLAAWSKIVTSPAMTARIEQFIRENPDFSNLLPLNEPFGKRNIDIQLTWTAFNRLTAVVRNFKEIKMVEEDGEEWQGDFESWVDSVLGKELYGEKPWVIWQTEYTGSKKQNTTNYEQSAWPADEYVESFNPCNSCGLSIGENDDFVGSCSECGTSIHTDGDCGPWLDHGQDGGSGDYNTVLCVQCYEEATGEEYGGYNRLQSGFNQKVAETITDEDIRQTLTFIEETFNTFEWR